MGIGSDVVSRSRASAKDLARLCCQVSQRTSMGGCSSKTIGSDVVPQEVDRDSDPSLLLAIRQFVELVDKLVEELDTKPGEAETILALEQFTEKVEEVNQLLEDVDVKPGEEMQTILAF